MVFERFVVPNFLDSNHGIINHSIQSNDSLIKDIIKEDLYLSKLKKAGQKLGMEQ